jgi:AcrR family transcriptional regulator
VPRNAARRDQLTDAGLAVLAEQGARGLTFRAVDARAGVPTGTASNYFADRDALLAELGERLLVRLAPGDEETVRALEPPGAPSPEHQGAVMRALLERVLERRELYLALIELRLEATRRPALHTALTETLRRTFEANVTFHEQTGLPGGEQAVRDLALVMDGLILDQLTVPRALGEFDAHATAERLAALISRGAA